MKSQDRNNEVIFDDKDLNGESKIEVTEFISKSQVNEISVRADSKLKVEREQWNNKIEYMLSVIGYVVDLGNCVRFPYVTYKNGGGAFLIPYFIFLILIGVPMMYLEMSIGQYFKVGNIQLWEKVNIYMKG